VLFRSCFAGIGSTIGCCGAIHRSCYSLRTRNLAHLQRRLSGVYGARQVL